MLKQRVGPAFKDSLPSGGILPIESSSTHELAPLPRMKETLSRPPLLLNLALLALFWLLLFNRLHTEWIVNTLYSYGWAVPLLALYLFTERWRDRPPNAADRPHPIWLIFPALLL